MAELLNSLVQTGTLTYVPNPNYNGKDDFAFKVHDGVVFSNDAKVSIKIQNNEKPSNDQIKQSDKQPKKVDSNQAPRNQQKNNDGKNNGDTPQTDSSKQSSPSTQDNEQPKNDQKQEEQPASQSDKTTSDTNTASSGDSQATSDSKN